MNSDADIRLATRGSDLALRQANTIKSNLDSRRREVTLTEVETTGDQLREELIHQLGKTGAFVRSLDEKVLSGELDAAVHSMKDMPTEMPEDLVVAGVPERAPSGDVLVTPDGTKLDLLAPEAVVGTSSLRRTAQLLATRPDLEVVPLRGNVDTRLEKLLAPSLQAEHDRRLEAESKGNESEYGQSPDDWFESLSQLERSAMERRVDQEMDAIVLAEAGIRRSGLYDTVESVRLPKSSFVPSPGQGAIAVTASDPEIAETIQEALDHPVTRVETTVERTVLAEVGGGCIAPIGVSAMLQGEYVQTRAQILSHDGTEVIEATRDLPVSNHADAAADFAADLRERGAADLIDEAREAAEAEADAGDDSVADAGGPETVMGDDDA
ncbi:hydroxymethylbilane synthase [Halohasta litchfieldiae]|jgi:hydroxymethylbilane synthase|uniref:Hydroxymethylbilane synthase n=1 Tax=Halohasta litchfieldiae TaxID=1073996 RepID=A0A1H6QXW8_9EURY|nr:hydroxymethylbilane synthase [Halohasta litchfieldiae]ATW88574.1 hydroxymethylbilane synthase [Halohasta litchfieldiae]SEI48459.1 hydroxymethylbilane synthase [Halohasta litchfieldiae]